MPRYTVNNDTVDDLLSNIKSGTIAIPEMQRPFVWDTSQVRDLMDSLYKGFPVGYIIIWQNPDVKLKDGSIAIGKKVLIDGQQHHCHGCRHCRARSAGQPLQMETDQHCIQPDG